MSGAPEVGRIWEVVDVELDLSNEPHRARRAAELRKASDVLGAR